MLCLFAATICGLITRPVAAGALIIATIAIGALLRPYCANMPTCWIRDPSSPPRRLPPSSANRPPKRVTAGRKAER